MNKMRKSDKEVEEQLDQFKMDGHQRRSYLDRSFVEPDLRASLFRDISNQIQAELLYRAKHRLPLFLCVDGNGFSGMRKDEYAINLAYYMFSPNPSPPIFLFFSRTTFLKVLRSFDSSNPSVFVLFNADMKTFGKERDSEWLNLGKNIRAHQINLIFTAHNSPFDEVWGKQINWRFEVFGIQENVSNPKFRVLVQSSRTGAYLGYCVFPNLTPKEAFDAYYTEKNQVIDNMFNKGGELQFLI
jgi:hypothetical protein